MNTPAQPIRFHRFATSGHSHRAELMLSLLGLPVEPIDVDLAGGAQKTPAYLAMNCFGQVPVIQDGDVIEINVAERRLSVELSEAEAASRKAAWKAPAPRYTAGVMAKYARSVSSSSEGAITN